MKHKTRNIVVIFIIGFIIIVFLYVYNQITYKTEFARNLNTI